jgi:hypothetical protein
VDRTQHHKSHVSKTDVPAATSGGHRQETTLGGGQTTLKIGGTVRDRTDTLKFERRWPVVLAILAVILLLALLPGRIRLVPMWVNYIVAVVVLVPIVAVGFTSARARWLRIERATTIAFFVYGVIGSVANLVNVFNAMVNHSTEISGLQLLTSGIGIWFANVIIFTLLYWQLDGGGPENRINDAGTLPDFLFPQAEAGDNVRPGWRPTFVDYLFLGYMTATAFSPTEAMPMTSRAKMLMMLQSNISLVTILIVAARAINILS